jgi:glycosyltransferase involved in cell wall biosynthesis
MRVLSATMFFPRGGSARVARELANGLRLLGCDVTLLAGSRADLGPTSDARRFYGEVHAVSFDEALASSDPLGYDAGPGSAPLHPSFEERPGAPDAVFASLDQRRFELQVSAWARELRAAGAAGRDVLHLHHLTPLNAAAALVAPAVPVVGQLHGTELLMLERIAEGPPAAWRHADAWAARLREWAGRCQRLLVGPGGSDRARRLLGVGPERLVELAGGVDPDEFRPRFVHRRRFWREVLAERLRGSLPGEGPGSVLYGAAAAEAVAEGVVLLYVGRFTAVKRLPVLIECFARARERAATPASLVLIGGHPGESEGEHPAQTIARLGAEGVFLAGWHEHARLPWFFSAADLVVTAAERESFGLLLVEGMACGLPAVAPAAGGPAAIVQDGVTGWLAQAGEPEALIEALAAAIDDGEERRRRGRAARAAVRERFAWPAVAARLRDVLADAAGLSGDGRAPAARRPG